MSENLIKDFPIFQTLGRGLSGEVVVVVNPHNGKKYAIKKFFFSRAIRKEEDVVFEKDLVNPFLLEYFGFFVERPYVCLMMEYCENGNILQWMKKEGRSLKEKEIVDIITQLVEALHFLHSKGKIHKNIKLENIFLNSSMELKLGDFGNIRPTYGVRKEKYGDDEEDIRKGPRGFIAPEIYKGEKYSAASDVFAVGCVLYFLMTRRLPFEGKNVFMLGLKVVEGKFDLITEDMYTQQLKDLAYAMLSNDVELRPTVEKLRENTLLAVARQQMQPRSSCGTPPRMLADLHTLPAELPAAGEGEVDDYVVATATCHPSYSLKDFNDEFMMVVRRLPSAEEGKLFRFVQHMLRSTSPLTLPFEPIAFVKDAIARLPSSFPFSSSSFFSSSSSSSISYSTHPPSGDDI